MSRRIVAVLVVLLSSVACGPIPTFVPTSTATRAPEPTAPAPPPTLDLEPYLDITLTQADLPLTFSPLEPTESVLSDPDFCAVFDEEGMSAGRTFAFFDDSHFQLVVGCTVIIPDRIARAGFDAVLRHPEDFLDSLVSSTFAADEVTDNRILPALANVGDSSMGVTVAARIADAPPSMRMDCALLRRDVVGVLLFEAYVDGEVPLAPIADLARLLDARIVAIAH